MMSQKQFPVIGYVHKESSVGVLLRDNRAVLHNLRKVLPRIVSELPGAELSPEKSFFMRFYSEHFTTESINAFKDNPDCEKQFKDYITKEEDKRNADDVVFSLDDMVPVTFSDAFAVKAIIDDQIDKRFAEELASVKTLEYHFPGCPIEKKDWVINIGRLTAMLQGILFVTWKPKYENLLFVREDGEFLPCLCDITNETEWAVEERFTLDEGQGSSSSSSDTESKEEVRLYCTSFNNIAAYITSLLQDSFVKHEKCAGEFI